MHEAAITQGIIDTALEAIREHEITQTVRKVCVTVGVSQGLIPDSMRFFFDLVKGDTPLADAELDITLVSMVARCPACAEEFPLANPILLCRKCGGPMELIRGKELMVTAIEVDE
jgi:hydrogenase nickel incorporation protein HypA/HybF